LAGKVRSCSTFPAKNERDRQNHRTQRVKWTAAPTNSRVGEHPGPLLDASRRQPRRPRQGRPLTRRVRSLRLLDQPPAESHPRWQERFKETPVPANSRRGEQPGPTLDPSGWPCRDAKPTPVPLARSGSRGRVIPGAGTVLGRESAVMQHISCQERERPPEPPQSPHPAGQGASLPANSRLDQQPGPLHDSSRRPDRQPRHPRHTPWPPARSAFRGGSSREGKGSLQGRRSWSLSLQRTSALAIPHLPVQGGPAVSVEVGAAWSAHAPARSRPGRGRVVARTAVGPHLAGQGAGLAAERARGGLVWPGP